MFCKLFVNTKSSRTEIASLIETSTGGDRDATYISTRWSDMDVTKNTDNFILVKNAKDLFLTFPIIVDIDIKCESITDELISYLSNVVVEIISQGGEVVASCDFEDELNRQISIDISGNLNGRITRG